MTAPTPRSLLLRAADILDERGWTQGDFVAADGCVCALGAVHLASNEIAGIPCRATFATGDLYEQALDRIYAIVGGLGSGGIAVWNDEDGRTKDEVQDMLRRAAGGESR